MLVIWLHVVDIDGNSKDYSMAGWDEWFTVEEVKFELVPEKFLVMRLEPKL